MSEMYKYYSFYRSLRDTLLSVYGEQITLLFDFDQFSTKETFTLSIFLIGVYLLYIQRVLQS
jgi:hypothetical protein